MKNNKIALITGSSNGIGAGIAKILGSKGYTIIITYMHHEQDAVSVRDAIINNGGDAIVLQLDVTNEESVKSLSKIVEEKYGKLDALVNNAAVDWANTIESSFEDWKTITRTKLDGNFLCTKYFTPLLKKAYKANIVIIMSILGDKPDVHDIAYSIATAGTIAFTKALAIALAPYGIRTNAIGPGATKTNNKYWADLGNSDDLWKSLADQNPLGRVCTPEDIGKAVLSVIEDSMDYINGNIIYVDGGEHLT